jgi:beta-glucosidase
MKKIKLSILGITMMLFACTNISSDKTKEPFFWGVATCAYQVEGGYQTDGKGESKWDFLTNKVGITQMIIGEKQTGNVSINMYDRTQYLKDIQLMKELGINSYRMSLDWSRIIPDGVGAVNEKALAHYDVLIDDLLAAGIEPLSFRLPQCFDAKRWLGQSRNGKLVAQLCYDLLKTVWSKSEKIYHF